MTLDRVEPKLAPCAMLGALAGVAVGRLGATYLILFGAMLDVGIVAEPDVWIRQPAGLGIALPGYGPGRVIVDAAFSDRFDAWGALALAAVWTLALALAVMAVLSRVVGVGRG